MAEPKFELSPLQVEGADWLRGLDGRYLADPPGFGKTRQLLAAVGEVPTVVVCPAAIRDAEVWQGEARRIGWDAPMKVISYHQLAQAKKHFDPLQYAAIIFDESHWLKNRKVSWGLSAYQASRLIDIVKLSSGTPTPNDASELWGQLRLIRDIPAFWTWADGNTKEGARGWFHVSTKTDRGGNVLSNYVITGHLQVCVETGCKNGQTNTRGELIPITEEDCDHWARFRREEQMEWMFGRPESALDLPPLAGDDTPIHTPMKPEQRKLYNKLKKDFLAELPSEGISLEALSESQKFVQLWMLSFGVASIDPAQDPNGKHSGKLDAMGEFLADRKNPVLTGTYFKNSAQAVVGLAKRLGLSYRVFGAATTPKGRKEAIDAFQSGSIDLMIGSIPVIGEGLTLTAADSVYLPERMWTPDKNRQVVRRVLRRGQDKPVGVRHFVTPGTVDGAQWEALKDKAARIARVDVAAMLGGEYKPLA